MVTTFPVAIGLSFFSVVALIIYSLGIDLRKIVTKFASGYQSDLDKADMMVKAEDFMLVLLGIGTALWIGAIFLIHLTLPIMLATLPLFLSVAVFAGRFYLRFKGGRRISGFSDQFEMVLRMMSGALRVGLGFRQAIILVTEEVPDPARRELMRVIGRANIGINLVDALDEMAKSVPNNETLMFARVVRVQQSTGGDLAKVLEKLAITIKDRRRILRKMSALTAQGRFGAFIIGALPIGVGAFVLGTQPEMKNALLGTHAGWGILGIVGLLEAGAIFFLNKILQLDA